MTGPPGGTLRLPPVARLGRVGDVVRAAVLADRDLGPAAWRVEDAWFHVRARLSGDGVAAVRVEPPDSAVLSVPAGRLDRSSGRAAFVDGDPLVRAVREGLSALHAADPAALRLAFGVTDGGAAPARGALSVRAFAPSSLGHLSARRSAGGRDP